MTDNSQHKHSTTHTYTHTHPSQEPTHYSQTDRTLTQADVKLLRLARVLKGTTTTSKTTTIAAAAARQFNSAHIFCTSQTLVRRGQRWAGEQGVRGREGWGGPGQTRAAMHLVCQRPSARECDRALEDVSKSISCSCPSTSAAADGSAASYCAPLWRRVRMVMQGGVAEYVQSGWVSGVVGGWLVCTCPKMMRLFWSVPVWDTWTTPPPGSHTQSHTHKVTHMHAHTQSQHAHA